MVENKPLRFIILFVAIMGLLAYFSGLTVDFTRDAGIYATVAKEIFQNGNYINLTVSRTTLRPETTVVVLAWCAGFCHWRNFEFLV